MTLRSMLFSLALSFALFFTSELHAHSEAHVARYVSIEQGKDEGNCKDSHNPCKTLGFAIKKAAKGDFVRVAQGQYRVNGSELFALLSEVIKVTGGYSTRDHFSKQNSEKNRTVLIGLPFHYRKNLSDRGFLLLRDKNLSRENQDSLKSFQRFNVLKTKKQVAMPCVNGKAGDYSCANVNLMSRLPLASLSFTSDAANDIWGYADLNDNSEYALIGTNAGTAIVNVTDPEDPTLVNFIAGPNSSWRDIKTYQYFNAEANRYEGYAYVTNETSGGLQVINLSGLPAEATLTRTINEFTTAHNVYISNVDHSTSLALPNQEAFIYVSGSNRDGGIFRVFSLTDPSNPALVARPSNTGYIHDGSSLLITDSRASQCQNPNACEIFIDFNENTVDLWDLSNKNNLRMLSSTPYVGSAYTHSGWGSADGNTVFIQDELDEQSLGLRTTLRALDISNLQSPQIVSTWTGPSEAIDHNGFTKGNRYYMSNYRRGLTILDVSNPQAIKQVALFDSFPLPAPNTANFDGAWGVYPYLPSGNIIISDIQYGLFTVKEVDASAASAAGKAEFTTGSQVGSGNSEITVTVKRLAPFDQSLSVNYQTYDDTATATTHYTATSGALTWEANDSSDKTITIALLTTPTDYIREFTLQLESENAALLGDIRQMKIAVAQGGGSNPGNPGNPGDSGNTGGGSDDGGSLGWMLVLLLPLVTRRSRNQA